ncbi:S-layer homology domain-containing protein [Oscillospiraceae bacterium OttesenSCG-928-G22]|nr:S-layer homology domain-containing protein [Oscillospiraceae bacterium OttesenSCG-928-G22]
MIKKGLQKSLALVMMVMLLLTNMPLSAWAQDGQGCQHSHDALCNYAEGSACLHVCDAACGIAAGQIGQGQQDLGASTLISAFLPLSDEVALNNLYDYEVAGYEFPQTLAALVDGESVQVPVSWVSSRGFEAQNPTPGFYVYQAQPQEGYTLAPDQEAPAILFYIRAGVQLFARGGGGTPAKPVEIYDAAQLRQIAQLTNSGKLEDFFHGENSGEQVYLLLMQDIDLSAYGIVFNDGKGWEPIGLNAGCSFAGHFDGGGFTVSGLYINKNTNYAGLFGYVDGGEIKNLGLADVRVRDNYWIGGLAGYIENSSIENCYVTGNISGDSDTGGLVGEVKGGSSIEGCYVNGTISGIDPLRGNIGGLVGKLANSSIENCHATGSVNGYNGVGGLVGMVSTASVSNSYVTVSVNCRAWSGGLVGALGSFGDNGQITNCAVLNPSVIATEEDSGVCRLTSQKYGTLSNNYAFVGMVFKENTNKDIPVVSELNGTHAADMTADNIKTAAFWTTAANWADAYSWGDADIWITQNEHLPILKSLEDTFGAIQSSHMPVYIGGASGTYFAGGTGADEANAYQIATAAQLKNLADLVNNSATTSDYTNKYYKLTADIDLSAYGATFNNGKGWIPIGSGFSFKGHFDGGGKVISGLYINNADSQLGLFGHLENATVANTRLEGVEIRGSEIVVGGLAGLAIGATITKSSVTGSVTGGQNTGGLVGEALSGTNISGCYAAVELNGGHNSGGLVGTLDGSITSCYATGNVNGGICTGGLVGYVESDATVESCYATGSVWGENFVGGLAGLVFYAPDAGKPLGLLTHSVALNPSVVITSNSLKVGRVAGDGSDTTTVGNMGLVGMAVKKNTSEDVTATSDQDGIHGADMTAAQAKTATFWQANTGTWNTPADWTPADNKLPVIPGLAGQSGEIPSHISGNYFAGGTGTTNDPYEIATAAQLKNLADLVNTDATNLSYADKCYKLTADIDLSAYGAGFNNGKGWVPIGHNTFQTFNGSFDGNSKIISGLYINEPSSFSAYTGLFGHISNGSVSNLGLKDVQVSGNKHVGGLAGYITGGSINECFVVGNITSSNYAGGLVGHVNNAIINCCYASGSVTGGSNTGGLAGGITGNDGISNIFGSYSANSVAGSGNTGGLVGGVTTSGSGTVSIIDCAALNPSVAGSVQAAGRVVGAAGNATLTNNYAFKGLELNGAVITTGSGLATLHGADMTATQAKTAAFWTTAANWSVGHPWRTDGLWKTADDALPTLKNVSGQSGAPGIYLYDVFYGGLSFVGNPPTTIYCNTNTEFTVEGFDSWENNTISWEFAPGGSLAGVSIAPHASVNGKGVLTVATNVTGTVTIRAYHAASGKEAHLEVTITKRTPVAADFTYTAPSDLVYSGTGKDHSLSGPDGIGTITTTYTGVAPTSYGPSTTKPKDVGTYSVSITTAEGTDYYALTTPIVFGSYTITPKELTLDPAISTVSAKTYDGTDAAEIAAVGFVGLQNGETFTLNTDYTVSDAQYNSADAGASNRTITATVALVAGSAKAKNYTLASNALTISNQTIAKATASGIDKELMFMEGQAAATNFDLSKLLPDLAANQSWGITGVKYEIKSKDDTQSIVTSPGGHGEVSSPLTVAVEGTAGAGQSATIEVEVTTDNFEPFTAEITVTITDKTPLNINFDMTGGTYDKQPKELANLAFTENNGTEAPLTADEYDIIYEGIAPTTYGPFVTAPVDAGTYQVSVQLDSNHADYQAAPLTKQFTIEKRGVTVRANDKSVTVGGTEPTYDFILTGELDGDTALTTDPSLSCPTADVDTVGSYAIVVDMTNAVYHSNYKANSLAFVNGTLTVNAKGVVAMPTASPAAGTYNADQNVTLTSATTDAAIYYTTNGDTPTSGSTLYTGPITVSQSLTIKAIAVKAGYTDSPIMEQAYVINKGGNYTGGSGGATTPSNTITAPTSEKGWTDAAKKVNALKDGSEFTIDMKNNTIVSGDFLEAIAGKDVDLTFDMGGGLSWMVNGRDIPANTDFPALNLGVSTGTTFIPVKVLNIDGSVSEVQMRLEHNGKFGFKMVLAVTLEQQNAGYFANLYYYNSETGELEFQSAAKIGADGTAEFSFDHASDYLIVVAEKSLAPVTWQNPFTDVTASAWYYGDVQYAVENGLFSGTSATTFSPSAPMTRAMLVTVLWRMEGEPVFDDILMYANFADVVQGLYYEKAVGWAVKNEIVGGYGEGFFGPDDNVTREQFATILYRYAKYKGIDVSVGEDTNILSYNDALNVSEYAVAALQWACGEGIITGKPGGLLDPQGSATRAEAAAMLRRYLEQ